MAAYLTLDSIVRSVLLKSGLPPHYYIEYLAYAVSGFKELQETTIGRVSTVELTVKDYKAVTLPVDYVDFITIGFRAGERIRHLIHDKELNHLYNYDSNNKKIPYTLNTLPNGTTYCDDYRYWGVPYLYNYGYNYSSHDFGLRTDRSDYRFCVMRERDEVQLSANYPYDTVIFTYLPDGTTADAASEVEPLAQDPIEKYIIWQKAVHTKSASEGERGAAERRYSNAFKMLRAKTSGLTKEGIIHAVRSGYGVIKW